MGENWYDNRTEQLMVAEYGVNCLAWDVHDLLYFIEKPWKYTVDRTAAQQWAKEQKEGER